MIFSKTNSKRILFCTWKMQNFLIVPSIMEYLIIYNKTIDFKIFLFISSTLLFLLYKNIKIIFIYILRNFMRRKFTFGSSFIPEMKQKRSILLTFRASTRIVRSHGKSSTSAVEVESPLLQIAWFKPLEINSSWNQHWDNVLDREWRPEITRFR